MTDNDERERRARRAEAELKAQLNAIRREKVPEGLLALARQLQARVSAQRG
ncbi:hypothetical protein [Pseudooceanicola batsensis]|nr:hypothetical protein [Pseudooceanicola batsensis]